MPNRYDEDFDSDEVEFAEAPAAATATLTKKERVETPVTSAPRTERTVSIKRGWGAAQKVQESTSNFAQRFKVTEEPQIIKFIEDEPYASFRTHWVERAGQKSFVCLADHAEGCPLCDAGNRPSTKFAFNIALLNTDGDLEVKPFEVGVRLIDQLKNFHNNPQQGPLSKNYWSVSKTGKGAQTQTLLQMVRERDLEEYGLKAFTDDDIASLKRSAYDPSIIQVPTRTELVEIASELIDAN